MDHLIKDSGVFLLDLLKNLKFVVLLSGVFAKIVHSLQKRMTSKLNKHFEANEQRINTLEERMEVIHNETTLEILRGTILNGIKTHDFSSSELWYLFEKYEKAGGNGFVKSRVITELDYLKQIEENQNENNT